MRGPRTFRARELCFASFAALFAAACGGKVIFAGSGAGGDGVGGGNAVGDAVGNAVGNGANGSPSASSGGNVDLEPICKAFCAKYQDCAPQTECKVGCMSSPVLACKKEYAADVVCITEHLVNCAGFSQPCADEQMAYQSCESLHP